MDLASTRPHATTKLTQTHETQPLASWKNGLALAGIAGIASFQPSLLARTRLDQGIVTGGSMALAFGVGVGTNALANTIDKHTGLDPVTSRAALAGIGAAGFLGATLALRGRPSQALELLRTSSGVMAFGAATGAALIGEQKLVDQVADSVPGGAAAAHVAILGTAAIGAGALLLGRARGSAVSIAEARAYQDGLKVPGAAGGPQALDRAHFDQLNELRGQMKTISGGPGSLLPRETLGGPGIHFISEPMPAPEIARVMDLPLDKVKQPVRVYGGVKQGATHEELAQKIFDESLKRGAFDRSRIMIYTPSGTGHIDPAPVQALEFMSGGDVASIGMQYGTKPSLLSLNKVDDAADLFDKVLTKFSDHLATMPEQARPKLSIYGESLGGWASQDVFLHKGVDSIAERGIDKAIWVGSPRMSGFRTELIGHGGQTFDATGKAFEFDSPAVLAKLPDEQRAKLTTYFLSHRNDPVNKFGPTQLWKRPEWLSDPQFALGVPRKEKWLPGVSGIQGAIDTKNGTHVMPGIFERTGHDYRADMAPVVSEVFGFKTPPATMTRIQRMLEQAELGRTLIPGT